MILAYALIVLCVIMWLMYRILSERIKIQEKCILILSERIKTQEKCILILYTQWNAICTGIDTLNADLDPRSPSKTPYPNPM